MNTVATPPNTSAAAERLSALVMYSPNPAQLATFYRNVLGIPIEAVGGTAPPMSALSSESNFCKAEPATSSCFLTDRRPVGSLCGCWNEKGDIVVGGVVPNAKPSAVNPSMTEVELKPMPLGSTGYKF